MRPGPATQAALLSRTFRLPSFTEAKVQRSSRNRASDSYERRAPRINDHLKLTLQSYDSAFSILLERRTSEEAAKAGHQDTGHAPNFPPVIHSRKPPATLNRFATVKTSHALTASTLRQ